MQSYAEFLVQFRQQMARYAAEFEASIREIEQKQAKEKQAKHPQVGTALEEHLARVKTQRGRHGQELGVAGVSQRKARNRPVRSVFGR